MTSLTIIAVAILIAGALSGEGYRRVLAIGAATPVGAALVLGDIALPTFYFAALGAVAALVLRALASLRTPGHGPKRFPGAVPLLVFTAWSILVTLAAPAIFAGTPLIALGEAPQPLQPGTLTTSNIAQIFYLILSVSVVFYLAGLRRSGPQLLGLTLTLVTALSFWKLLGQWTGLPFPVGLFDNSPAFRFIEMAPGGAPRFRGIFSEPAALATSSLVTVAYMLSRSVRVHGRHRIGTLAVAAMAATLAAFSTSGTFVVAGVSLVALAGISGISHVFFRGRQISSLTVTLACVAVIGAIWLLPVAGQFVEQTIDNKLGSDSYDERSGADAYSYDLVINTWGIGVGLGDNRPSSFAAMLLGNTGLVGIVLFASAVWIIIRRALRFDEFRPVVWALVAVLITKTVSGADLADSSGILWISIGLLAGARRFSSDGDLIRPPAFVYRPASRRAPDAIIAPTPSAERVSS